jgi:hypothetical protein
LTSLPVISLPTESISNMHQVSAETDGNYN